MDTEKLIHNLFRICDKYVNTEDFVEFEKEFAAEVKQTTGLDLYQIYYGESFDSLKQKYARYQNQLTE